MGLTFKFLFAFCILAVHVFAQVSTSSSSAGFSSSSTPVASSITSSAPSSTARSASVSSSSLSALSSSVPSPSASAVFAANNSTLLPQNVKLDIPYGFAGATLIITGGGLCVSGGKNRWTSLFLAPFHAGALVTTTILLHYALPPNTQNPPREAIRGVFVLVAAIVGILTGAAGVISFSKSRFAVPLIGGFSFGWFLMATKQGGLTGQNLLWRWVLIACVSVAFLVIGLFEKLHHPTIIITTSWLGASAFVLGLDCFTRAGLKEFYIYNLGYRSIFTADIPNSVNVNFQYTQLMQVELALIGILAFLGAIFQFKMHAYNQKKKGLKENDLLGQTIEKERADEIRKSVHANELAQWEAAHGPNASVGLVAGTLKRNQSSLSNMKDQGLSVVDRGTLDYVPTLGPTPSRTTPSSSTVMATTPASDETFERKMDQPWRHSTLGSVVEGPKGEADPDEKKREELLREISTIRRSIEILRSSSSSALSPPDQVDRPKSVSLSSDSRLSLGRPLGRSPSVPVDSPRTEWEAYLASRQIYRQPSSPPAPTLTLNLNPELDQKPSWASKSDERRKVQWTAEDSRELLGDRSGEIGSSPRPPQGRSSLTRASASLSSIPKSAPLDTTEPAARIPREMSRAELLARHEEKMRAMQTSVNETFVNMEARSRWEERRQEERELMRKREDELKQREAAKRQKRLELEAWRECVRAEPGSTHPKTGR